QGAVRTVDLPGTYSLTSFSLEERVARDFLLQERPDVTVNVVDASNLRRSLHLSLQLLEMELPLVLVLNMVDVAEGRGQHIDPALLAERLEVPVVRTVGRKGEGRENLRTAIRARASAGTRAHPRAPVDYRALEQPLDALTARILAIAELAGVPGRWLALKLLEEDGQALALVRSRLEPARAEPLLDEAARLRQHFEREQGVDVTDHVVGCRERAITALLDGVFQMREDSRPTLTERIDRLVLNRWMAPAILVLTVFLIYQVAIVWGYELTTYTWPWLAKARELIAGVLPEAGFLVDPYTRAMGLWLVDSANTLLNYVPIFLILFALIAMLEDSGYMARIAFILDKVLHRFGLHGQSTLPFILAGVFAGGCAVPG
ncbi:MAG: ferrous iron transporter B, partial [Chromatiaceae bacterium]|nr:ferrous iron transporter B [Chromatiaceae bacterium]